MKLSQIILMLVLTVAVAAANDTDAAFLDRAKFPPELQNQLRYVSTESAITELERTHLEIALKLIIPSSSRQDNLDLCTPVRVSETLWRIDLVGLQWDEKDWLRLVAKYPYHPTGYLNPLRVDAKWLLVQLTDQTESDTYLRLVFGEVPASRDRALQILKVDGAPEYRFGLIEGDSGVAVQKVRWIENRPISRGYAWGTRDSLTLKKDQDPLERPDGGFKHDGEEWIIGLPKFDPTTGFRGALQVYFLSNGQGGIVAKAPIDLVEDRLRFRGVAEIRNPGSCIQCHSSKLNPPGDNQYRVVRDLDVEFKAVVPLDEQISRFHMGTIGRDLDRNNEDCSQCIQLVTKHSAEEATLAFSSTVSTYDAELTLERAAHELFMEPKELGLAIAYANANNILVGTRFAALAYGKSIPRESFEERYLGAYQLCQIWRNQ
jgi:hypothetical protein